MSELTLPRTIDHRAQNLAEMAALWLVGREETPSDVERWDDLTERLKAEFIRVIESIEVP